MSDEITTDAAELEAYPTLAPLPCPEPGIYEGMPAEEYHRIDACNNSSLSTLLKYSPMHVRYERMHPKAPTPAMTIGTALHTWALEPEKFDSIYIAADQCCGITGKGTRCTSQGRILASSGEWFCGTHGKKIVPADAGKIVLAQSKIDQIKHMGDAIMRNRAAAGLLKSEGQNEVVGIFDHPAGVRCKLRTDCLRVVEWSAAADIKTTECASPSEFERTIAEYGYYRQAAFYQDGLRALGVEVKHFAFIVVEKTAPYGVAVYRMMDDAIELGRDELNPMLATWRRCVETGVWWDYGLEFHDISIPRWKARQIMDGR
jgi:hypothetical protein